MDSKTEHETARVAGIVERGIERCERDMLAARGAEYGTPAYVAELAAVRRSFEREARWWQVLLRGTGYGEVPMVFRRAVISAQARAERFAEQYAEQEEKSRAYLARQQQDVRGRAA